MEEKKKKSKMYISREKNYRGLTQRQEKFLEVFPITLNVYKSAEIAEIARTNIMADLSKDTPFANCYRAMVENLDNDPRYNKAGSIKSLQGMIDELDMMTEEEIKPSERIKLKLDIQKEINKMIEGNLASSKKIVENKTLVLEGVYDFTKKQIEPKAQNAGVIEAEIVQ